ncbi:hypothetical protein D3Z36_04340 [Lachnospiraceae bacterium]|nr:hypothetical protein [Lachnospiraceae bacterium]
MASDKYLISCASQLQSGARGHSYGVFPRRFNEGKYTACTIPFVFRIRFQFITWTHRQRFPDITKHLVWVFIHAHNRTHRIDRTETADGVNQTSKICYRFGGYIGKRIFKTKILGIPAKKEQQIGIWII